MAGGASTYTMLFLPESRWLLVKILLLIFYTSLFLTTGTVKINNFIIKILETLLLLYAEAWLDKGSEAELVTKLYFTMETKHTLRLPLPDSTNRAKYYICSTSRVLSRHRAMRPCLFLNTKKESGGSRFVDVEDMFGRA